MAILAAIAVVLGWLASAEPAGSARQVALAVIGVIALLWGGYVAWHGRRRS
jgi:hypothetical protein